MELAKRQNDANSVVSWCSQMALGAARARQRLLRGVRPRRQGFAFRGLRFDGFFPGGFFSSGYFKMQPAASAMSTPLRRPAPPMQQLSPALALTPDHQHLLRHPHFSGNKEALSQSFTFGSHNSPVRRRDFPSTVASAASAAHQQRASFGSDDADDIQRRLVRNFNL